VTGTARYYMLQKRYNTLQFNDGQTNGNKNSKQRSDGKGIEKWKTSDKNILRVKITVLIISFQPGNLKGRDNFGASFQTLNS
jgi:hypothetical protein